MTRLLSTVELELLRWMLAPTPLSQAPLDNATVREMEDGGMGGIEFLPQADEVTRQSIPVAEASFEDDDGVPVSIVVYGDEHGRLLELDFWKADFSRLRRYPSPQILRRVNAKC